MGMFILNKKETSGLLDPMMERFGLELELFADYAFMANEKKDKIWIASRGALMEEIRNVRIETIGLLFARKGKTPDDIKPTTNVMQIFGKH